MNGVVHAETNGEHDIDTGDDVDGDVPEVQITDNVCEGDGDDAQDIHAYLEVSKEKQGGDEDGGYGEPNISPQLKADDLVALPSAVDLVVVEGVGGPRLIKELGHCTCDRDVDLRVLESKVTKDKECNLPAYGRIQC